MWAAGQLTLVCETELISFSLLCLTPHIYSDYSNENSCTTKCSKAVRAIFFKGTLRDLHITSKTFESLCLT